MNDLYCKTHPVLRYKMQTMFCGFDNLSYEWLLTKLGYISREGNSAIFCFLPFSVGVSSLKEFAPLGAVSLLEE